MKRTRIFKLALSLVLALVTVVLAGWSIQRRVQSFQALGFDAAIQGGAVLVGRVSDPRIGLQPGDMIMLIDGHEVTARTGLVSLLRERPERAIDVLRGPEMVRVQYHRPPLDIDVPFLILAFAAVAYLLIGLYTLLRQGGNQGFLFYLWCLASAASYLLSAAPPEGSVFKAIHLGDEIARLFLPALTLHLSLVFPAPFKARWWNERIIPFLYLPAALLLTLQLDLALTDGHWIFGRPLPERLLLLDRIEMVQLGVFAVAAVAVLIWRLIHGRDWEQHRQMQWLAFGLGGGYAPFLVLYLIPNTFGLRGPELLTAVSVLPLALVPLAFAYAILRYKLWDIEVIVRDTISLTLTLLLGAIGFSLANLAINRGVSSELAEARNLLSFVAGLVIAGLLVPARKGIGSALERFQYRGRFGKRRALSELGRELLHERDLGRLCGALLRQIKEGVDLDRVNLFLMHGDGLAPVRPEPDLPPRLPLEALGPEVWKRDWVALSGVALPGEPTSLEQRLFIAGYRYAFALTLRGRGIGLALTGFKEEQAPLNSDDTELIRHLMDQAALAIENAQLLGQLHLQLEEVRHLQRYSEGIFESSPAGIAVLDAQRNVVSANAAFAEIAGRERQAVVGSRLAEVLPVSPLPAPGEGPLQVAWCDSAGQERYLQISLAAYEGGLDQNGLMEGDLRVLVVHDISERVALENAMREKDRLAALGMLAAGVAHEVNTPITGISSYAQMLLADTPENDPHYEILKKVERQTFRASRIVNNLLEFARNRQKERKPVAVTPLLRECVDLLSERLERRRIALEWELPEEKPGEEIRVLGCDGELQQVFTNLLVNALDAVIGTPCAPEAGAQSLARRRPAGRIAVALEPGDDRIQVRIEDNGPGIPAEKLDAIFQPFYSTKLNRGGTGLGLSISYDIVHRHGGELRAVSRPGEGACFIVELPRLQVSP